MSELILPASSQSVESVAAARRRAERIRLLTQTVSENVEKLRELVHEAKAADDHLALGYASWTAYLSDLFGDEPLRLTRDVRRELVAELAEQGMSARAIAPIVGVDRKTVDRDIAGGSYVPPAAAPAEFDPLPPLAPRADDWVEPGIIVNPTTGEVVEPTVIEHTVTEKTKTVIGLDGKTYERKPRTQNRRAITDDARDAGWALRKAAERIQAIAGDDRFGKNKAEVMAALQPHLDFAHEVLADF